MENQSLLTISKKIRALAGSILMRCPLEKVRSWAENEAVFQRTRPVTFDDMHFENDRDLVFLKKAFHQGLLREVDIVDRQNNIKLHTWFLEPCNHLPTVIYSYGNSANLSEAKYLMDSFAKRGFGFMGWSYPGYEHSRGCPSEKHLTAGLQAISDYLMTYGIEPSNQIAMGHSLGGLVSVDLATRIQFRLLVLITTPPNIPDYYEYLLNSVPAPIRWACIPKEKITQRFDALPKMPFVKSPVLFIHSDADEEVPLEMARKLLSLSKTPNYEHVLNGAPHDLEMIPLFAEEICDTVCRRAIHPITPSDRAIAITGQEELVRIKE